MKYNKCMFASMLLLLTGCRTLGLSNSGQLVGVQNVDLKVKPHGMGYEIVQEERDTLSALGINLILNANQGSFNADSIIQIDTLILHWAGENGGFPKLCLYPARFKSGAAKTYKYHETSWPKDRGAYWWGEVSPILPTHDTIFQVTAPDSIPLGFDMGEWTYRKPRDYGTGTSADHEFQQVSDTLIDEIKTEYGPFSGLFALELAYETHAWNWRDTVGLPNDAPNHPWRVLPSAAENAAKHWRQGMNYMASRADSEGVPTYYLEEGAFVIGYGGRATDSANWDSIVWHQQSFWDSTATGWKPDTMTVLNAEGDFFGGMDGVPDTLARLAEFFEDMSSITWHGVQLSPYIHDHGVTDSNSIYVQKLLNVMDHSWRAMAQGIAQARKDQRAFHRLHPDTPASVNPVPVTQIVSLMQSVQNLNNDSATAGSRMPTQQEFAVLANIGFSCGVKAPCWYVYDKWYSSALDPLDTSPDYSRQLPIEHGFVAHASRRHV